MADTYEVLSDIDFGQERHTEGPYKGQVKKDEDQPEQSGLVRATPPGEDNPEVSLEEEQAEPLLEAGAIKPKGSKASSHAHDNPEELGYEGEAAREAADEPEEDPDGLQEAKSSRKGKGSSHKSSS